jgi:hypothetical protein
VTELYLPDTGLLLPPSQQSMFERMRGQVATLGARTRKQTSYPRRTKDFIKQVLGADLWDVQERICDSVDDHRYTAVASCHGIGKSYLVARIVVAYLNTHPGSIVITSAPTGRQVEHVVWRNIRHAVRSSRHPLLGLPGHPLTLRYDIADDWYAIGFKPTDTETDPAQGFHAEDILVVVDEGAGYPDTLFQGFQAAMTTERARFLAVGNPTSTAGWFHEAFHGDSNLWNTITVSWEDTPNAKAGRTVRPYLITQQWVDDQIARYGKEHPYVQTRVYARWTNAEDVLIPVAWIDNAQARGMDEVSLTGGRAGLDVARYGADSNVLVVRQGNWVPEDHNFLEWSGMSTTASAERAVRHLVRHHPYVTTLAVDVVGLGSGVVDRARDIVRDEGLPLSVVGVNVGAASSDNTQYGNAGDEMWWSLREAFREGAIAGHLHPKAKAELSDRKYRYDGRHTMPRVESKEEYKKRHGGQSPDYADATLLAFIAPPPGKAEEVTYLSMGQATMRWGPGGK